MTLNPRIFALVRLASCIVPEIPSDFGLIDQTPHCHCSDHKIPWNGLGHRLNTQIGPLRVPVKRSFNSVNTTKARNMMKQNSLWTIESV